MVDQSTLTYSSCWHWKTYRW